MLFATLVFAGGDVATKYLTTRHDVSLILALRYAINLALLVAILAPRHGHALFRTHRTGLVLLRAGSLAVASLSMGYALRYMPVGETVAIMFLAPFGIMLASGPILGERVTLAQWVAAVVGFAGVLLIIRPGAELAFNGVLFALLTAVASVVYNLLSRLLVRTDQTMTLLVWTALVGLVVFALPLPWTLQAEAFPVFDLFVVVLLGAAATLGHFMFTAAFRKAPASLLAPVSYMHLAWAAGLGWMVFGHIPDVVTVTGMALVALAGSGVALYSHVTRKRT